MRYQLHNFPASRIAELREALAELAELVGTKVASVRGTDVIIYDDAYAEHISNLIKSLSR